MELIAGYVVVGVLGYVCTSMYGKLVEKMLMY